MGAHIFCASKGGLYREGLYLSKIAVSNGKTLEDRERRSGSGSGERVASQRHPVRWGGESSWKICPKYVAFSGAVCYNDRISNCLGRRMPYVTVSWRCLPFLEEKGVCLVPFVYSGAFYPHVHLLAIWGRGRLGYGRQ
jgi:hypothetical protein